MEQNDETEKAATSNEQQQVKKLRLFSAKNFRNALKSNKKLAALQEFAQLCCSTSERQQYIFEYFEAGGSCQEILQTLDGESDIPQAMVFEILTHLLLEISAKYPQLQKSAHETCKYLLYSYMTLINKMLGLNSRDRERKVVLKLLTAVAQVSPNLARDVLIQVNFHPTNLEILTKHGDGHDNVRNALIHFIAGFLVDNHYPTISILLEKHLLLTSIIRGLQYDQAESVCVILTALKNHVLENLLIPKTSKMHTFNTAVIKDIVNLYNWRGPGSYNSKQQKKKVPVNEYDKSKVSESTHQFLLVLCTSHKYGIIFKDHSIGLSGKYQNKLVYTVLESLERPWEHSYAGELVIKICTACPDLTRSVWANLRLSLEPRPTVKWLKAVKFARDLLIELVPSCFEFCVGDLTTNQLGQVTQMLVAPTSILKTLFPENIQFDNTAVKLHVLQLLADMLKTMETYAAFLQNHLSAENFQSYKKILNEHMARNFPNALAVISNWSKNSETADDFETCTIPDYVNACFELFQFYEGHCISLLDGLISNMDLHEILQVASVELKVKIIGLFLSLDNDVFSPSGDLFVHVFPPIFEFYYESRNPAAYTVLHKLLQNSNVFQSCEDEIGIWLDCSFEVKNFDCDVTQLLAESVVLTSKKIIEYLTLLAKIDCPNLSPLLLGVIDYLAKRAKPSNKQVKSYLGQVVINLLHLQLKSNTSKLGQIVKNESTTNIFPKDVLEYLLSWENGEGGKLEILSSMKTKCKLNLIAHLAHAIISNSVDDFIMENSLKIVEEKQEKFLFRACIFWFVNFAQAGQLTLPLTKNCLTFIKQAEMSTFAHAQSVLSNPILLQFFSPLSLHEANINGYCTYFITELVRHYRSLNFFKDLQIHLRNYRGKIFQTFTQKQKFIFDLVEIFDLDFDQIYTFLNDVAKLSKPMEKDIVVKLVTYCLRRVYSQNYSLNFQPLEGDTVASLSKILTNLIGETDINNFAEIFDQYINLYPHSFEFVQDELFENLCLRATYAKETTNLAAIILSKKLTLMHVVVKHIEIISSKKGLMLAILAVAVEKNVEENFLKKIYDAFAPSIQKALQKPQKAGQHFEKYFKPVGTLLQKFLPVGDCNLFLQTVQKFDITSVFHLSLLEVIFDKAIFTAENFAQNFLNNSILTFIHSSLKRKEDLNDVAEIFARYLQKICVNSSCTNSISYEQIATSEVFKTFCKFCLKFGISGNEKLLMVLGLLLKIVDVGEDGAGLLMEMILSHSEFLEVVLSDVHRCKTELLTVIGEICRRWEGVMQKDHVPILLAAYSATLKPSDRIVLGLLRRYESQPARTFFYDFKPFLWGPSAANHYSVRSDVHRTLWKQPKMRDVLDILKEPQVKATLQHHCLTLGLNNTDIVVTTNSDNNNVYDLTFLLPMFSMLLASENVVHTYKFLKSGAFSLTIVALSNEDKDVRTAACLVLSRFYHHLEISHRGKDNTLWIRFVEAICKGTSAVQDFKLNNFASLFLARMALILTNPTDIMYVPLSQYLMAKATLDFSSIPELYTLLHSADVSFKSHRNFILEVLRDGLRSESDVDVFLRSMSLKLVMEFFSTSSLADLETQLLILEVLQRALCTDRGVKYLCTSYGFLSWMYQVVIRLDVESQRSFLPGVVDIVYEIARFITTNNFNCSVLALTLSCLIDRVSVFQIAEDVLQKFLKSVCLVFEHFRSFLNEEKLRGVIRFVRDEECEYLLTYGGKYVDFVFDLEKGSDVRYYVKYLTLKWIMFSR